jgi:flagellar hook assembly protein FlgD
VWDLTDDSGNLVPAGQYTVFLEASLRFENSVLYSESFEIGKESAEKNPQPVYTGEGEAERGMISDVKMLYAQ